MEHITSGDVVEHLGYGYSLDNTANYSYAIIQHKGRVFVIPIDEFAESYKSL